MGRIGTWLFAAILVTVGATLAIGGAILAANGGSLYYIVTGLLVLASAWGLLRRRRYAALTFGLMLAFTVIWSLWEVGLESWALMPRLVGPAVVGLFFLLPGLKRAAGDAPRWWVGAPAAIALLLVASAVVKAERAESGLPGAGQVALLADAPQDWSHWGNNTEGTRYSPVAQINTGNVQKLELAWRYDSDVAPGQLVSLEAAPLGINGRLYMCVESGTVAALDQETGKRIWQYRGLSKGSKFHGWKCRGVAYYAARAPRAECTHSLYMTTAEGELIAIDADTGKECQGFAASGRADLKVGMGPLKPDDALPTSPPTVVNGVVVVGQSISDYGSFDAPSGVIRGYDAETGVLKWAWDAGRPGQTQLKPGEIYTRDTPNAWGVFSGDEQLGLVFVGTGNSPPDYYAHYRSKVADEFTDNVVAIDVNTGLRRWSFKTVNHDRWDYDVAAQPTLIDLEGKKAVLVPTKRGEIFVLDRLTGQPIDPVVQKKVPQGAVKGDWSAPTQPYTTGFPSVAGPDLTEADMWGLTPLDQMACRIQFRKARYQGQFTPITTEPTITYPAVAGGINWQGVSVDTQRGLMVVNSLHLANINRLIPRKEGETPKSGFEGGVIMFPQAGTPYGFGSYPFLGPLFAPCQKPPYTTISVFDIKTRKLVWSKPLGTAEGSGPLGIASHIPLRLGAPNFGGSLSTAGGLVFIAAGQDRRLRAFDIANGKELWSAKLPAVGAAMPISYVSPKGRQFVVIAAGGHFAIPGPKAAAIMAYALPR